MRKDISIGSTKREKSTYEDKSTMTRYYLIDIVKTNMFLILELKSHEPTFYSRREIDLYPRPGLFSQQYILFLYISVNWI